MGYYVWGHIYDRAILASKELPVYHYFYPGAAYSPTDNEGEGATADNTVVRSLILR